MADNWQSLLLTKLGQEGVSPSDLGVPVDKPATDDEENSPNIRDRMEMRIAEVAPEIEAASSSGIYASSDKEKVKLPKPSEAKPEIGKSEYEPSRYDPENVKPGILEEERYKPNVSPKSTQKPTWQYRIDPSPKAGGWVPKMVAKRRRVKPETLGDEAMTKPRGYEVVDQTPSVLDEELPVKPKSIEKKDSEPEGKVSLVRRVLFDETGEEIEVDRFVGLAKEFVNFARGIIQKVKSKNPHEQNSQHAAESMQRARIVWDNREKFLNEQSQLLVTRKGSQMEGSDQNATNQLLEADRIATAEIGADTSLEGVGTPVPPKEIEQIGEIEVTDIIPAVQSEHGPVYEEGRDDENPLEAHDAARAALDRVVGHGSSQSIAAPAPHLDAVQPTAPVAGSQLPEGETFPTMDEVDAREEVAAEAAIADQPIQHFASGPEAVVPTETGPELQDQLVQAITEPAAQPTGQNPTTESAPVQAGAGLKLLGPDDAAPQIDTVAKPQEKQSLWNKWFSGSKKEQSHRALNGAGNGITTAHVAQVEPNDDINLAA